MLNLFVFTRHGTKDGRPFSHSSLILFLRLYTYTRFTVAHFSDMGLLHRLDWEQKRGQDGAGGVMDLGLLGV